MNEAAAMIKQLSAPSARAVGIFRSAKSNSSDSWFWHAGN